MSRPAPSVIGWDDESVYCQVFLDILIFNAAAICFATSSLFRACALLDTAFCLSGSRSMRMDISRLIGAMLKAVRRKAARLKSARLKAVMELLPVRRIIFFFIRGPIHIPKLIHILKPKPKFVRTTKLTIIAYAQSFIFVRGIHSQTHTHTYIYIFIRIFNAAANRPFLVWLANPQ